VPGPEKGEGGRKRNEKGNNNNNNNNNNPRQQKQKQKQHRTEPVFSQLAFLSQGFDAQLLISEHT
jgi:hypothetical protein